MSADKEFTAIRHIRKALASLENDQDSKRRVLTFVLDAEKIKLEDIIPGIYVDSELKVAPPEIRQIPQAVNHQVQ